MSTSKKREIVVCNACHGTGRETREECVDYHRRDYETVDVGPCHLCEGSGRLSVTTTVETEPFVPRESN